MGAPPLDYIIYDTFSGGAQGDPLSGHTPEVGGGWTQINGNVPTLVTLTGTGFASGGQSDFALSTTAVPAAVPVYYEMAFVGGATALANRLCAGPVAITVNAYGANTFIADAFQLTGSNWWVAVSVADSTGEIDYQEVDTGVPLSSAGTLRVELAADRRGLVVRFNGTTHYTGAYVNPLRPNTYFAFAVGSDADSVAVGEI